MKTTELRKIIKEEISSALKNRKKSGPPKIVQEPEFDPNRYKHNDGPADVAQEPDIRDKASTIVQGSIEDEEISSIIEDTLDTIYDLGNDLDGRELIQMFTRALSARAGE